MEMFIQIVSIGIGSIICLVALVSQILFWIEVIRARARGEWFSGLLFIIPIVLFLFFVWGGLFILGGVGMYLGWWDWKVPVLVLSIPVIYRIMNYIRSFF